MGSITNIGNIYDRNDISESNNPIFTLPTQSFTSDVERNGYHNEKQKDAKSCQCGKSTFRKFNEHPRENRKTQCANTNHNSQVLNHKTNPSLQKIANADKSKPTEVSDKQKGCHWTCGTKMFSKSEKVNLKRYIIISECLKTNYA